MPIHPLSAFPLRTVPLLLALLSVATTATAIDVVRIDVQTRRGTPMDPNFVRFNTRTRAGQEFSRTLLAEDIKTLQRTGRFSSVRAEFEERPDGLVIIYVVQPRTNLREIFIEGNEAVSTRKFKKLLELERGDLVDNTRVSLNLQAIEEKYRDRYHPNAEIAYDLDIDPDTGAADLRIKVDEGERLVVDDITFRGNKVFGDGELRETMEQKRRWRHHLAWWEWISPKGQYDEGAVETDRAKLRAHYLDEGYLDAEIGPPQRLEKGDGTRKRLTIEYPVTEGPRYRIGTVHVEGVKEFPVQQIRNLLPIRTGGAARMVDIEDAVQTIRDYYGARGHVATGVDPRITPAAGGEPVVNLVFKVTEGVRARIRDVIIRGNNITKDKVIRRELTFFPGEILNEVRIRASERKLRNTQLFSYVRASRRPTGNPNEYDVVVDVEEARTGQLLTGFGFSSVESIFGFVQLGQNNFDLFNPPSFSGGGQKISIRAQLGTSREDIEITHIEPWFLDRKLRLTTRAFYNERRFLSDDYDQRSIGSSIGVSRSLNDFWRTGLTYGLEEINVYDVSTNASDIIRAEEGKQLQSSLTLSFTHDSRDRFLVPTSGNRTVLSAKWAGGPLGADVDIYELRARAQQHYPVVLDHVLSFQGRVSTVDTHSGADRVPLFDREFLGGPRTIRAFRFRDVGPKDEDGEPIGGNSEWWATAEYTIPLAEQLRFATFYDMGMVTPDSYDWEFGDFNSSAGIGVRIDLPMFPLQLDYSWPLESDEHNDNSGRFSFLFGTTFR